MKQTRDSGDLVVSGLSVSLGGRLILDRIDLSVPKGTWLGLVGPNGAGKTTLLSSLNGLVASRGSISWDGTPLAGLSVRRRAQLIASVPQRPVIPSEMTVGDYVLLGRTPHIDYLGSETGNDYAAAAAAVTALELVGFERRRLGTLSGGETQRAILARALAQEAPLMLLDEPTTSLDIGAQQSVLELVEAIHLSRALTVISSLHDLTLAAQFCDELLVLDKGRIVARGRSTQVLTEDMVRTHFGAEVDILHDNGRITGVVPIRR
ncbi:MAG TPA: ABC transporter ATP-binding protein [Acidimicrobiia bacterium]|nr:ABC transporter ATP-binding protein [Acidimicrobiia bacterium]